MTYNKKKAAVFELAFDDELKEVQKLVGIADDSGRVQRNCAATHASQYLCACLADPLINGPRSATTNVEVSRSSVGRSSGKVSPASPARKAARGVRACLLCLLTFLSASSRAAAR
jgi:hypothetical protein